MAGVEGATGANVQDEQRRVDLARIIESLSGKGQALVDAEGREAYRVTGCGTDDQPDPRTRAGIGRRARSQGARGEGIEPNSLVGQNLEGITNNTGFKQWIRKSMLVTW